MNGILERTPSPKSTTVPRYRHSLKYSGGALHDGPQEPLGGFPNEIKTKIRYLIICCYHNLIL